MRAVKIGSDPREPYAMPDQGNTLWVVPAVPVVLFGLGLGLMLCDIKPGFWLMGASWLMWVPAAVYGCVKVGMAVRGTAGDVSYAQIGAGALLIILDLIEFGGVIAVLKSFTLRLF